MPACWVISPIVTVDGTNKPKVSVLGYAHSSAIYPNRGKTWALSYVSGPDFVAIDADPDCERVFDEVEADQGSRRPSRGDNRVFLADVPTTPRAKLHALLEGRGAVRAGLDTASTRREWLKRLGMAASGDSDFRPEGWHTDG